MVGQENFGKKAYSSTSTRYNQGSCSEICGKRSFVARARPIKCS